MPRPAKVLHGEVHRDEWDELTAAHDEESKPLDRPNKHESDHGHWLAEVRAACCGVFGVL
jgi:hypothetical protein